MFHRNTGGPIGSTAMPTAAMVIATVPSMSDDSFSTSSCESVPESTGTSTHMDISVPSASRSSCSRVKVRQQPSEVELRSPYYDNSKASKPDHHKRGIYVSYRIGAPLVMLFISTLSFTLYTYLSSSSSVVVAFPRHRRNHKSDHVTATNSQSIYHLRTTQATVSAADDKDGQFECRWYLAESAIPHSGLGIFTGIPLHKGDMIGYPDICIFVSDGPSHWTHLRSHSFGRGSFFGQYEGDTNRAACEGLITTVNTVPDAMVNMEMVSPILPTNAGLHRAISPGAGASTHHFGIHGKALDTITAGAEITINYGDWDFENDGGHNMKAYERKPTRDVPWLQRYGWCIDYIDIDVSTIPHAGRGAFARTGLDKGTVVAPAPLQVFHNRNEFKTKNSEQLYVNYCIQPAGTEMLLFPYGQGVNLINHSSQQSNVEFRWSTNKMHHNEFLDLSTIEEFWKMVSPGSLVLEIVALRDIEQGEELLLNYGSSWDDAWNSHVENWRPEPNSTQYVYPSDMDETLPVRTIKEQVDDPYPENLVTMCLTNDFEREEYNHMEWSEPTDYSWAEGMVFCHVLERTYDSNMGDDSYTVSLVFNSKNKKSLLFDPTIPLDDLYIDYHVPRRAIRFIEKPYHDDEHLPNAFRHPIELPMHLVPGMWKIS